MEYLAALDDVPDVVEWSYSNFHCFGARLRVGCLILAIAFSFGSLGNFFSSSSRTLFPCLASDRDSL
jgi:hypothetical protein